MPSGPSAVAEQVTLSPFIPVRVLRVKRLVIQAADKDLVFSETERLGSGFLDFSPTSEKTYRRCWWPLELSRLHVRAEETPGQGRGGAARPERRAQAACAPWASDPRKLTSRRFSRGRGPAPAFPRPPSDGPKAWQSCTWPTVGPFGVRTRTHQGEHCNCPGHPLKLGVASARLMLQCQASRAPICTPSGPLLFAPGGQLSDRMHSAWWGLHTGRGCSGQEVGFMG